MRRKMVESGGMMKLAPVRPKIPHSAAQMMSEQNMGMRTETPKMLRVMTAPSIQVLLEALPDLLEGVDVDRVAAEGLRVVAARDAGLGELRVAARAGWPQHAEGGDVEGTGREE